MRVAIGKRLPTSRDTECIAVYLYVAARATRVRGPMIIIASAPTARRRVVGERCERCDREDCPTFIHTGHEGKPYVGCETCRAESDCHTHAVDWRARALRYEAALKWYADQDIGGTARAALDTERKPR